MRWSVVCVIGVCLTVANPAAADVDSYYVHSLEWLTDASQSVRVATVVREKGPGASDTRIKSVDRVLKGDKSVPAVDDLSPGVTAAG